nr:hypothetical protein [Paracoccaceae bacterium]
MARVSRWAIFIRAFLITLLAGTPARVGSTTPEEEAAWTQAAREGTIASYYSYLSRFPAGTYVDRAIAQLIQLGAITPAARELPTQPRPQVTPAQTRPPTGNNANVATPTRPQPAQPPQLY